MHCKKGNLSAKSQEDRAEQQWLTRVTISRTRSSTMSARPKIPLTIFLVNGVKLQGVVTWFDNFCLLLRRDGHSQLVYKHAISTVMPSHPVQLFEPESEEAERVLIEASRSAQREGATERRGVRGDDKSHRRRRRRARSSSCRIAGSRRRAGASARPRVERGAACRGGQPGRGDRPRRRRGADRAAAQARAGDADRHRQGRGDRRARARARGRARHRRSSAHARCSSAISRRPGRPRCSTAPA